MDLTTNYMGMKLRNPLIASASPLSARIDAIRQMEDAGSAAIVLHSLFEEQVAHEADELEHYLQYGADRFAESLTYYPDVGEFRLGPEEYLDHIRLAKEAVDIPIIGSLNGISAKGWVAYAAKMQQAGADAVELNVYYLPTDPKLIGAEVEDVYVSILRSVKEQVSIPLAMKLSPYLSATANMLSRLDEAGADGLVLFNRFYQPDVDVDNLAIAPSLLLSQPFESRLAMRWIAIMYGKLHASLVATGGIHSGRDAAKMILVGADVAMMTSAVLKNGTGHFRTVLAELAEVMERKGYESVAQMRGVLSQEHCAEPAAFERANYMKTLASYGKTATLE